jgi:hypothetical protein
MNFSHNQWIKLVIRSVNQGSIVDRRISPAHYPLEHVWLYQSVSISVPSKSVATGPSSHMLPKRASDWRQTNGCKNTTSPPCYLLHSVPWNPSKKVAIRKPWRLQRRHSRIAPYKSPSLLLSLFLSALHLLLSLAAVGAPSIVIIQDALAGGGDGEPKFKVASMHLGGLRLKSAGRRNVWDGEKQRLTAMHWLVAYGLSKVDGGRKSRAAAAVAAKAGNEVLWSMSSRVMADMWLKPISNPT